MLAKYLSMSRCERFGGIVIANRDVHRGGRVGVFRLKMECYVGSRLVSANHIVQLRG